MNMDLIFGNFLPETLTYNTTADENRRKEDIFISVSVQFLPIISNNIQISSIKLSLDILLYSYRTKRDIIGALIPKIFVPLKFSLNS